MNGITAQTWIKDNASFAIVDNNFVMDAYAGGNDWLGIDASKAVNERSWQSVLTPIFYPMSIVPGKYLRIVRLNPLVHLLQIIRDPIYNGRFPTAMDLMISSLWAFAALISGWVVFRKLSAGFYAQL